MTFLLLEVAHRSVVVEVEVASGGIAGVGCDQAIRAYTISSVRYMFGKDGIVSNTDSRLLMFDARCHVPMRVKLSSHMKGVR